MQDTAEKKKSGSKHAASGESAVQPQQQESSGSGVIAEQLQSIFGNQVMEESMSTEITAFASVLRDATQLNNLGVSNAGPMGTLTSSMAMDIGGKAREAAAGALKNGAQSIMGDIAGGLGGGGGGGASDLMSGFAMRDANGGGGGFSQAEVASNIKGSSAQSLPSALSTKLSLLMGMDMSKVRIHTDGAAAQASSAMGAHAFALGSDVFFNSGQFRPGTPEGDALIVHELTHVVQAEKGALPSAPAGSGITTSSPSDGAEVEATDMASKFAGMLQLPEEEFKSAVDGLIKPMQGQSQSPLDGFAMRKGILGFLGLGGADEISLSFNGGGSVSGPLPEGAEAGQTVQVTLVNDISGVTFGSCSVTLDDDKQPASGTVSATVQVGEFVGPKTAQLTISAGGKVEASITDVPLKLGSLASGKMTCQISSKEVTGAAVLKGSDFNLAHNFKSDGGQMAVELKDGKVKGEGTISGNLQGIGTMDLAGKIDGAELTGLANVTVDKGLQLVTGVKISSEGESKVSGTYTHSQGCKVEGKIVTDVKDFMRGTVTGGMDTAQKQWNAKGYAEQLKDYSVGNIVISNGLLQVEVENGSAGPMEGEFAFTWQEFKGTLSGTYDPATNIAAGEVECSLASPKQLGEWGVLEKAKAKGTLVESKFEEVTGSFEAKLNLDSQPTFQASLEEGATYKASSNEVSGTATFETIRELRAPKEGSSYVKIPVGAIATADVNANKLEKVDGTLDFQATDGAGDFAEGTVNADFTGGVVNGNGSVSLTSNYGIPQRTDDKRYIHTGATLTADVKANELQTIQLTALGFTVKNPSGGNGQVDGKINAQFVLPTPQIDGSIEAAVVSDWDVPVSFGTFAFTAGGEAKGTITANELKTLEVNVPFKTEINGTPALAIDGNVEGKLDIPATSFTGKGTGKLSKDAEFVLENGHKFIVKTGSGVEVPVADNAVEKVALKDVQVEYVDDEGKLATGTFNGDITTADLKVTGTGKVTLDRDVKLGAPGAGERIEDWQAVLNKGGSLDVTLKANVPEKLSIDVAGKLLKAEAEVATGNAKGDMEFGDQATGFSGEAGAAFSKDVEWKEGSRFEYFIGEQTDVKASVAESKITEAKGLFSFLGKEDGTSKTQVDLDTTYTPGTGLSGTANLKVLDDIEIWKGGEDKLVAIAGESSAKATVENDVLTKVDGDLKLRFDEKNDPLLEGQFSMNWAPQEQASLDGTAKVTTLRDYQMGQNSPSGLQFFLDKGASVEATMEKSTLQRLKGKAGVSVKKGDVFAKGSLEGDYDHTNTTFSGKGAVEVTKDMDLGAAYPEGKALLKKGAGATGEVAETELKELTVKVPLRLDDNKAGRNFAEMELQGSYKHPETEFSGTASAKILKKKEVGKAGKFTVLLMPDSGASATVDKNELTKVDGTVKMRGDTKDGPFASAELKGTWTKGTGMNGTGEAKLLVEEYEVATLGSFKVYVIKGTGAKMTVVNNEVTKLSGSVPFEVRKGSDKFMKGKLEGTADLKAKEVTGKGTVEIVKEQQLATFKETTFWVTAGTGISVDIAGNKVNKIGGNLNLSLRQPSEFLKVNLTDGKLDLSDKPLFSGTGAATVTREQKIFTKGDYSFAVTNETSAKATLADNEITSIKGTVGFRVYNKAGALLKGKVEGDYDGTTGNVNGSGRAELEQEQKYGPKEEIRILPKTSGQADITNSEVTRVKGTIYADLHDDKGALVHMEAEGEFDAVKPELIKLEGTAKLLRSLEPIPGVIISDVVGKGKIAHNKIVEVSGSGKIAIEKIGLTGAFEANWAVEGGKDTYWGEAKVGLNMDKSLEGHSARGVTGAGVEAELTKAGDVNVKGTVEYAITDRVKGSISLEQNGPVLDPILSGTLEAEGTLVDGREIFAWEKTLFSGVAMAGPIPISYGVKGAMGLTMKPVTYDTDFAVDNFHILKMNVPDFEAKLKLEGGADFYAAVLPYVGVGVSFPGTFTALGGLEGQAKANIELALGMEGTLIGKDDKYGGELGIGAKITPSATLSLTPFAEFDLLGFGGRHDFGVFSHTFNDLFEMGWETTYTFGDAGTSDKPGAENTTNKTPGADKTITQNPAKASNTDKPSLNLPNTGNSAKTGPEGGPKIGGEDQTSGDKESSETPSKIEEARRLATLLAKGVKGILKIVQLIPNPVAAVVEVITNFDAVQTAVNDVIACIAAVGELMNKLLPDWWEKLKGWIEDGLNVLADGVGMVLDGGKWVVSSISDGISAGWNYVFG